MSSHQYAALCALKVQHQYFSTGFDPDTFIIPSKHSVELMRRLKLQWRATDNRLDILATQPKLLQDKSGELIFYICCHHCNFTSYSQLSRGQGLVHIRYQQKNETLQLNELVPTRVDASLRPPANSIAILSVPFHGLPARDSVYSAPILEVRIASAVYPWMYVCVHQTIPQVKVVQEGIHIQWDASQGMSADLGEPAVAFSQQQISLTAVGGFPVTTFLSKQGIYSRDKGWPGGCLYFGEQDIVSDLANPSLHNIALHDGKSYLQKLIYI